MDPFLLAFFFIEDLGEQSGYVGRRSSMSPGPPGPNSKLVPREQRESSSSPSHRSSRQIQSKFVPGLPGFGVSSRGVMEDFRTKLLEKFTTIKEAQGIPKDRKIETVRRMGAMGSLSIHSTSRDHSTFTKTSQMLDGLHMFTPYTFQSAVP